MANAVHEHFSPSQHELRVSPHPRCGTGPSRFAWQQSRPASVSSLLSIMLQCRSVPVGLRVKGHGPCRLPGAPKCQAQRRSVVRIVCQAGEAG